LITSRTNIKIKKLVAMSYAKILGQAGSPDRAKKSSMRLLVVYLRPILSIFFSLSLTPSSSCIEHLSQCSKFYVNNAMTSVVRSCRVSF
jgi:hypothetical protein